MCQSVTEIGYPHTNHVVAFCRGKRLKQCVHSVIRNTVYVIPVLICSSFIMRADGLHKTVWAEHIIWCYNARAVPSVEDDYGVCFTVVDVGIFYQMGIERRQNVSARGGFIRQEPDVGLRYMKRSG